MVVIQLPEFVALDFEFCLDSDCHSLGVLSTTHVTQVYLLDSTGSRAWIDHEGCKEFVSNVLTAFPDSVLVSYLVRICE